MAYSLQPGESAGAGLKRVVIEEIDATLASIAVSTEANRDGAIHEARKSIKKIRAVLRLVRDSGTPMRVREMCRREMRRLRATARGLSDLRDAAAMVEAFDLLMNGTRRLRAVHAGLAHRRDRKVKHRDADEALSRTVGDFQKMKRRAEGWELRIEEPLALKPVAARSRKKARRLWKLARKHSDPLIWHEFRKKVKDQLYRARLLGGAIGILNPDEKNHLDELEEALGEDHNLVVLNEVLSADPKRFGGESAVAAALDLLGQKQRKLRELSLSLGSRLYGGKDDTH